MDAYFLLRRRCLISEKKLKIAYCVASRCDSKAHTREPPRQQRTEPTRAPYMMKRCDTEMASLKIAARQSTSTSPVVWFTHDDIAFDPK